MAGNKSNVTKLVIMGVAIAAIVFLIWRLSGSEQAGITFSNEAMIEPVTVDSSVFNGQKFKNLRGYGQYPVNPGIVGRENPFVEPTKQELKAMGIMEKSR